MGGKDQKVVGGASEIPELAAALGEGSGPAPGTDGGPGPGDGGPAPAQSRTYAPEEVAALVTLPAEAMYAITGSDIWLLDEREKSILAEKTAEALSIFMQIEPKWFVGLSFLSAVGAIYGTRTIAYLKEKKEQKQ